MGGFASPESIGKADSAAAAYLHGGGVRVAMEGVALDQDY